MKVSTVNDYLSSLDSIGKAQVSSFINFMEENFPQYKVKISFSMPMWWMGEKMNQGYIGISAAKKHFSIHFSNEDYVAELIKTLPRCNSGKRCINIPYHDEESYNKVCEAVINFLT